MPVTRLEQPEAIRVTGTSRFTVVEARVLDAANVQNLSDAISVTVSAHSMTDDLESWLDVLRASEETSLRFLHDEPNLYDDDGESV